MSRGVPIHREGIFHFIHHLKLAAVICQCQAIFGAHNEKKEKFACFHWGAGLGS